MIINERENTASVLPYSHQQLQEMTDPQRLDVLRESWGSTDNKVEVWGELRESGTPENRFVKLAEVRSLHDNSFLSYPGETSQKLRDRGIFISQQYAWELVAAGYKYIRCEVELAPQKEREKHANPLQVNVKNGSAQPLRDLPLAFGEQMFASEDATLLYDAVYLHYLGQRKQEIAAEEASLKQRIESSLGQAREDLSDAQRQLEETRDQHTRLQQENRGLQDTLTQLQGSQSTEAVKLATLQAAHEKAEKNMSRHLARLKTYIEEKATLLRDLEFIDAEEFDGLFTPQPSPTSGGDFISFEHDLANNYRLSISYIQAYLYNQGIIYPRHVLENFFALLRTQDLIILAGDSGSGKTNLVQSFAQAIGGVAKIIPVKPNWTSSEDLLGYYNPLEKKYLATPFLEALFEAQNNPQIPYLICLDEMNLARVEYYFADFLSKLEQRTSAPEITLFSDNESSHVLSELSQVMEIIRGAKDKYQKGDVVNFVKLLQDEELNSELRRAFGFSEQDSLIKYHADIRRMLAGVLKTPSSLSVPPNVRFIGAINIDETTHYLSPKILDRAHVMKFSSPLLTDWQAIADQVERYGFADVSQPLQFNIDALGVRQPYPKFDPNDAFCQQFVALNRDYFHPMGVEFGLRAIRQGQNYISIFADFNTDRDQAINNFVLHKVLPKLTFDGNKSAAEVTRLDLLFGLAANLGGALQLDAETEAEFSAEAALQAIARKARDNDGIVNYWA